jgi:vancomycin permeability regulator SanA
VSERTGTLRRRALRWLRWGLIVVAAVVVLAAPSFAWVRAQASGNLFDESNAPTAEVVIVLGAAVEPGSTDPKPILRGRLDTAAQLVLDGRARVVLVSGDGGGRSGDDPRVMTDYLIARGIPADRIVGDPYGLDTYDSCLRAKRVYGVDRALIVTQSYHLARAVALCRHLGVDTAGVGARCECSALTLARNATRDYFASSKAALDAIRDRDAAVTSPPDDAVQRALR